MLSGRRALLSAFVFPRTFIPQIDKQTNQRHTNQTHLDVAHNPKTCGKKKKKILNSSSKSRRRPPIRRNFPRALRSARRSPRRPRDTERQRVRIPFSGLIEPQLHPANNPRERASASSSAFEGVLRSAPAPIPPPPRDNTGA